MREKEREERKKWREARKKGARPVRDAKKRRKAIDIGDLTGRPRLLTAVKFIKRTRASMSIQDGGSTGQSGGRGVGRGHVFCILRRSAAPDLVQPPIFGNN